MTPDHTVLDCPPVRPTSAGPFVWLEATAGQLQGSSLLQEWLRLVNTSRPSSAYLHPDVVLGMAKEHSQPLICARSADAVRNCWSVSSLAVLAPRTQRLRLIGTLPFGGRLDGHRLIGNQILGVVDQDTTDAFVRELARSLFARSPASAFILFEDVEVGTTLWRALTTLEADKEVVVFHPRPAEPHWWIDFPTNPDKFLDKWPYQRRTMLRRKMRKSRHSIRCYSKPDDVAAFLEEAGEISKNSWQSKSLGLRIRNDARTAKLLGLLASQDALRSYILTCDGRPAAFEFGVQWQGVYYGEETGYDQALAAQSPGILLLYRLVEDLIARDPPRCFDFGPGDGPYMHEVANRQTRSGPVYLFPRGLRSDLARAVMRLKTKASGLVRVGLDRLGLLSYLRARYRK